MECKIVESAEALVSEIKAKELPPDFDPGGEHYNQILAHIRHEYTNYEELLYMIEEWCLKAEEAGDFETCIANTPEGEHCILNVEAHDILKWAAKHEAEAIYCQWLETHGSR